MEPAAVPDEVQTDVLLVCSRFTEQKSHVGVNQLTQVHDQIMFINSSTVIICVPDFNRNVVVCRGAATPEEL